VALVRATTDQESALLTRLFELRKDRLDEGRDTIIEISLELYALRCSGKLLPAPSDPSATRRDEWSRQQRQQLCSLLQRHGLRDSNVYDSFFEIDFLAISDQDLLTGSVIRDRRQVEMSLAVPKSGAEAQAASLSFARSSSAPPTFRR
jgi:hypothetical protein